MESKKESIRKFTKALGIVSAISFVGCIIGAITMVIYTTAFFYKSNAVMDTLNISKEFGLKDINDLYNYNLWTQSFFFILKFAQIGIISAIFVYAYYIFRSISTDGVPFKMYVATRIRTVAILSFVYSVIPTMTFDTSDLTSDFNAGDQGIIISIIFICIAKIFEYGCMLQQESDETL